MDTEQAVIVHFAFDGAADRDALIELENELARVIEDASAGEFDGDLLGEGECILYMYGTDADRLFNLIDPLLRTSALARGGYAIKRYGGADDSNVREIQIRW